jgi:uncharacterized membrane protein YphA (DoxX/SURF4 family)
MLNLVPIQFLSLFAYAILRIVVGYIWCQLAITHYRERTSLVTSLSIPFIPSSKTAVAMIILTESVIGMLFILGLGTQIAALLAILWCIKLLVLRKYFSHKSFPDTRTTVLLLTIAIALFITGAGIPAFDLPI